jgi:hypothetical protein
MTQSDRIAHLKGLAEHARMSHAYWLRNARQGGLGVYGPAYCLAGAGIWRRRLGELLAQLRVAEAATRQTLRAA